MHSQCHILLEAFLRGEILTAQSAFTKYNIATFSQRKGDLQRRGYNIVGEWVESPNCKRFMQYRLIKTD